MRWEERLLFLMFLDYKGALKKWEKNHDKCKYDHHKIDHQNFTPTQGFDWWESPERSDYWHDLFMQWRDVSLVRIKVPSLDYEIERQVLSDTIRVGCQKITKEDALKIADFIYECFGEDLWRSLILTF